VRAGRSEFSSRGQGPPRVRARDRRALVCHGRARGRDAAVTDADHDDSGCASAGSLQGTRKVAAAEQQAQVDTAAAHEVRAGRSGAPIHAAGEPAVDAHLQRPDLHGADVPSADVPGAGHEGEDAPCGEESRGQATETRCSPPYQAESGAGDGDARAHGACARRGEGSAAGGVDVGQRQGPVSLARGAGVCAACSRGVVTASAVGSRLPREVRVRCA
jgi:hypothetical protein